MAIITPFVLDRKPSRVRKLKFEDENGVVRKFKGTFPAEVESKEEKKLRKITGVSLTVGEATEFYLVAPPRIIIYQTLVSPQTNRLYLFSASEAEGDFAPAYLSVLEREKSEGLINLFSLSFLEKEATDRVFRALDSSKKKTDRFNLSNLLNPCYNKHPLIQQMVWENKRERYNN